MTPTALKGPCFNCGTPGQWSNQCPHLRKELPPGACPQCKQLGHWKKECLLLWREREAPRSKEDWRGPSFPVAPPERHLLTMEEPQDIPETTGKQMNFLIDIGAPYTVLMDHIRPLTIKLCNIKEWTASLNRSTSSQPSTVIFKTT